MTKKHIFCLILLVFFIRAQVTLALNPSVTSIQSNSHKLSKRKSDRAKSVHKSPVDKNVAPRPGDTWTDSVTGMEFVFFPKGCFKMGQSESEKQYLMKAAGPERYKGYYMDEGPCHEVCIDGFWMGKFEVTQGQWGKIMSRNPSKFKSGDTFPVENISWNAAQKFILKLNQLSGKQFMLPTEAQWEFAAKSGGKKEMFAGGDCVDRFAWFSSNSGNRTHRVGEKAPNGFGVFDMSGNVWEWCLDKYNINAYSKHARNNPYMNLGSHNRVIRGGCWMNLPWCVRVTGRDWFPPDLNLPCIGFRLCLSQVQQAK